MIAKTGRVRLPIAYDVASVLCEVQALPNDAWTPHFHRALYRGDWSGVELRGRGGGGLYPNPHGDAQLQDTVWLSQCPSVRAVVQRLQCETTAVRLLRVGAHSEIHEHRDYDLSEESGEARLHLCLQTNEAVTFFLGGEAVDMKPGTTWYIDVNRPHRVVNAGTMPRIHLVVDCLFNDWLHDTIARGRADG